MRMDSSSGKSTRSRLAICSGDQPLDPFAVTPMWLVPAFEGRVRRSDNLMAIGVMHLAL
jgi:hypothetical protein